MFVDAGGQPQDIDHNLLSVTILAGLKKTAGYVEYQGPGHFKGKQIFSNPHVTVQWNFFFPSFPFLGSRGLILMSDIAEYTPMSPGEIEVLVAYGGTEVIKKKIEFTFGT